ncbi:hypothetical protein [Flavobacterium sp.]|uniref:hypothetical protein n=1 Tax=Flavobacterium sp. TaxID=239 RepID=UPI003750B1B0
MKTTSIICFFLFYICLGCAKELNGFGEKDFTCNKYDAVNDVTYVKNGFHNKSIKVKGIWKKYNCTKSSNCYINHCPKIIDKDSTKLELLIMERNDINNINNEDIRKKYNSYITNLKQKNIKVNLLYTDLEDSYYVLKVFQHNRERIIFMGIKNKMYNEYCVYNFKNSDSKIVSFLIEIFYSN